MRELVSPSILTIQHTLLTHQSLFPILAGVSTFLCHLLLCPTTLKTTSVTHFRVPWGHPFQHGICDLYHSRLFAIPQPLIPYQWYCLWTNTRHTIIPYQSYSTMAVTGCLGSFLKKYKNISAGCYTRLLGAIMNRLELGKFLSILRHQTIPASEIQAVKERLKADWQDPKSLHMWVSVAGAQLGRSFCSLTIIGGLKCSQAMGLAAPIQEQWLSSGLAGCSSPKKEGDIS